MAASINNCTVLHFSSKDSKQPSDYNFLYIRRYTLGLHHYMPSISGSRQMGCQGYVQGQEFITKSKSLFFLALLDGYGIYACRSLIQTNEITRDHVTERLPRHSDSLVRIVETNNDKSKPFVVITNKTIVTGRQTRLQGEHESLSKSSGWLAFIHMHSVMCITLNKI